MAINPDQIGFIAADNRTRVNHRQQGHLQLGCATHLLSEHSVIGVVDVGPIGMRSASQPND